MWRYEDSEGREDLGIMAPLKDGSLAAIEHLSVTTPTKNPWPDDLAYRQQRGHSDTNA